MYVVKCLYGMFDFDPCEFIYIASNSYHYIFRTVNAMNLLISTLHITPFLCVKMHKHSANIIKYNIPRGSKPPHLHSNRFKFDVYVQCRGVQWPLICLFVIFLLRTYGCAKLMTFSRLFHANNFGKPLPN